MEEKVDVLVATYNGEKYLREQLDSIIKQTYKNIRILISDDCSKDRTQEILQEYEKKDDRIKIFLHDKNLGSNKNFEFLLNESSNDLEVGVAATLQIWKKDKKIPILAMSANAYMQDIQKCYEAGMNGHISKPLYLEDLKDRIVQIV